ncbi:MAG: hypothetical protein JNJ48_07320, partial [Phycisphaerae bacterium]|nr:hypothetical protein [Phycisphaerae bacterium]
MSSSDALMLSVSGCRGTIGGSLTPEVAQRFAAAFAGWLKANKRGGKPVAVALGRDGRRGSDLFAGVARAALLAEGCDVVDLDIAMTPTVGVMVDRLGLDGGLVVTASHNPQNWCGLKPIVRRPGARAGVVDASAPGRVVADELIARFGEQSPPQVRDWRSLGHACVERELGNRHQFAVRAALGASAAGKLARFAPTIVVDNLGMSGAVMSDWALRTLAPKSRVRQAYESTADLRRSADRGVFPHTPEPTRENLAGLCRLVKKHRANVGFAQDPDADRLAIIDEQGRYIGEEYTLVLAAMALGELGQLPRRSVIAVNLSTSRMIEDVAARYGCRVVRTAVGEANVVSAMKAHRSPLG